MKKLTLHFLILFLSVTQVVAQEESATEESKPVRVKPDYQQHEINVGFTNLFNNRNSFWEDILFLEYYDDYYYGDIYSAPFFFEGIGINGTRYGLGYKFHLKKGAIRSYVDYGINNNSNKNSGKGGVSTNPSETKRNYSWKSTLFTCRIGYEFIINKNKTDFFFGADGIFQTSDWKYEYSSEMVSYQTNYQYYNGSTTKNKSTAKYQAFGGGAVVGLRYHLTDMISIATETRMDITGYQQKGKGESSTSSWSQYNTSISSGTDEFSSSGLRTKVSPLGLFSLNVHL